MRHLFISSIPWFSAAAEYAFQLALYLRQQGDRVDFLAHSRSGLSRFSREAGFPVREVTLRPKGLRAAVTGALRVAVRVGLSTAEVSPQKSGSCLIVWVLGGHEHSAACVGLILRKLLCLFLPKRSALRSLDVKIVRLRCQDQFRSRPTNWTTVLDRLTETYVLPSFVAARRLQAAHPGARVVVQPFGKDFAPLDLVEEIGLSRAQRNFHPLFSEPFLDGGEPIPVGGQAVVLVCVARFDPVKGLHELIQAFGRALFDESSVPICSLVIVGRSENVRAHDLASTARAALGLCRSMGSRHFARNASGTRRVYVLDERIPELARFLAGCTAGVISSLGSEIVCRTAVEFLQVGLPVVATPIGSLPETLPAASTFFAEEASEYGLRLALELLLTENTRTGLEEQSRAALEHGRSLAVSAYGSLVSHLSSVCRGAAGGLNDQ